MDKVNLINWHDIFYYDPTSLTGIRWKFDRVVGKGKGHPITRAGDVAGYFCKSTGYYNATYKRKTYSCHRIIWWLHNGGIDADLKIDHIDGNKLNNAVNNLRLVSHTVNLQNQTIRRSNTSGVPGVYLYTCGKGYENWVARWYNFKTGKDTIRSFSTNKYGFDVAFQLACECRARAIKEQIDSGAHYTDRHVNLALQEFPE